MAKPRNIADFTLGIVFSAAGLFILAQAMDIRQVPGMPVGPGLFPKVTGAAMAFFGFMLVLQGWLTRPEQGAALAAGGESQETGMQTRTGFWARIPFIPALLAAIALTVPLMQNLGFLVTGVLLTAFLVLLGGGSWKSAAVFSPIITVAVYGLFYHGLRVPLPHGILG